MLKEIPDGCLEGVAGTPSANHLFQVDENSNKLTELEALLYHHNTAKLIFLSKQVRPDVQIDVAFMCTRITHPDVDATKKLKRVIRHLQLTKYLPLTLEDNGGMHVLK